MLWLGLAVWASFAPIYALVMGRRGHSPSAWGIAGLFLGPLLIPTAVIAARFDQSAPVDLVAEAGPGPGPVKILAGIDGSPAAVAALQEALALLGDRAGKITLVAVEHHDELEPHGREWLRQAAAAIPGTSPGEIVTTGEAASTLARLAEEGGYDVLVVGPTGRGLSPRLFGSVARGLATAAPIPLLLGTRVPAPAHT